MKKFVIGTFLTLMVGFFAFAGQSIRWYALGTPTLNISKVDEPPIDATKYQSKVKLDPKKLYYYQSTVQTIYSRGTFPFASVKVDTTSRELLSKNYFNE